MLLVINSGEEGLGNLKGSRKIMETFGDRVTEFFTLDGVDCAVTTGAVGSKRYRIETLAVSSPTPGHLMRPSSTFRGRVCWWFSQ
mgnify:CR=1 FL=1